MGTRGVRARSWSENQSDTVLEVQMLPARQGDAIWVRWLHDGVIRQLIVDMGTRETGGQFRQRLLDLPEGERTFELSSSLISTPITSVACCRVSRAPLRSRSSSRTSGSTVPTTLEIPTSPTIDRRPRGP